MNAVEMRDKLSGLIRSGHTGEVFVSDVDDYIVELQAGDGDEVRIVTSDTFSRERNDINKRVEAEASRL